ncbi:MAG: kynureninase [bacterium]
MEYSTDKSFALEMDTNDPLSKYREQFHIPKQENGDDCIYFCGNSLGLQPKAARSYVEEELDDWAKLAVDGHLRARHPWLPYHEFLCEQTARAVGARPIEVVVMNTLTVNLHLMLVSFYRPTAAKHKILMEAHAFPSDQYAVKSQIRYHGFDPATSLITVAPRSGETHIRTEDIESFISQEGDAIALVLLGGVNYYTGQAFEMERIVQAGHAKNCTVGFDLAHAAGNIPLELHDWNVDFAVWCSYKYLSGGPGCVAGCFVHERHANRTDLPRFAGWWGQNKETRFQMGPEFEAIPGAEGWQLSNPPILPMATLRASMDLFDEIGLSNLRKKSLRLTGYLEYLLLEKADPDIAILTPSDPNQRGCQLSLRVRNNGMELYQRLKPYGIVCDWREPDVIRVAPVPLYNTFEDIHAFVQIFFDEMQKLNA